LAHVEADKPRAGQLCFPSSESSTTPMHLKLIENAWRRLRRDNHHGVVIIVVVAIIIMPRAAARLIIISSGTYAYVLTTASTAAHCHNC
jgi:hypothetical protein